MDSKSLLTGLLTGIAIGGLSALLTAPAPGNQTRSNVKNFNWRSLNRKAADEGKHALEDWQYAATEGFEAVDGLTQEMKKTYSRYKEEVEPEVEAIQHQVREISDAIAELNEQIRQDD
ncbi:YtxH domain-containing protein [Alteribacillus persepolensis]|uniref:YtxH domain-containing protein n=1 Tax=Alteribacillus persepolensis TaxID=568899 RepID=UPI0015873540|nr:YtxH domain-containing protein [Alteribacillus persepolensis]